MRGSRCPPPCHSRNAALDSPTGLLRIALIGMPGAGKSSVGRQLARRLGVGFQDSDASIEVRLDESIRSFFEREGESRFRDVEQAVIADLCSRPDAVVLATGGGAILRAANREVLADQSSVIYLHAAPDELFRRLRRDTKRPLLQQADPQAVLRKLYAERDPLYRTSAHFIVETGRPTVKALVDKILMQLDMAGLQMPAQPAGGAQGREDDR